MYRAAGILAITAKDDFGALLETKNLLAEVIQKFKPEMMAIEKLYITRNQKTAMQVAEARGVIMLGALEHKLTIAEYTPSEIKAGLTGYGAADKAAVSKMVRLRLQEPDLKLIDDAMDALAVAMMAAMTKYDHARSYPQGN